MKLAQVQALLWDAIRHPTGIADFLAEASPQVRAQVESAFAQSPEFDRRARLDIYAQSYFWRLSEVLGDQYRVCAWLVGGPRFHNLVTDYVLARPSRSPDLRRYGRDFPDYLAAHALAGDVVGLAELSLIERALVAAIDAPDVPALGRDDLTAHPVESWPRLRFAAAPWVRLMDAPRSYPRLFEARRRGDDSPDPVPAVDGGTHHVLVWRAQAEVFHRTVPRPEADALHAMLGGETFETICQAAPDIEAAQVVAWLDAWLGAELIVGASADPA